MTTGRSWHRVVLAIVFAAVLWRMIAAAESGPVEHTPEQLAALRSLDAALERFDADLAHVTDVGERTRVEALLDVFKTRREAMRKARFDQVRCDELRFDLNVEYQRLGRYLSPLNTRPSDGGDPRERKPAIQLPDLKLVLLPVAAGTFVMGQPQGTTGGRPDETPATRVILSKPFWLGATEVTVGQWRKFAGATSYRSNAEKSGLFVSTGASEESADAWKKRMELNWRNPGRAQTDEHPVVGVNWEDAQAFCAWLTARERETGRLPAGYVFSLPTEAQWEYACRAGNRGPDPENLDAWTWHAGNSGGVPHAVATKRPNPWGFFDLQGNVAEWCLDWYAPYPGGMVTDLVSLKSETVRVCRGGSARSPAAMGISSTRRRCMPEISPRDDLGFRVALVHE